MTKLQEQILDTLSDVEWLIFGTWDSPRCPWCKAFKKRGDHKPDCKRQALIKAAQEPQQLEMFEE